MADTPKGVDQLCVEHGLDARQLAAKCGLDEGRVLAIVLARWTPSPQERDAIAKVFGLTGLTAGPHTVRLLVLGTKGASSSGYWVQLDRLDVR